MFLINQEKVNYFVIFLLNKKKFLLVKLYNIECKNLAYINNNILIYMNILWT